MDARQQRLIEFFRNLPDTVPPPPASSAQSRTDQGPEEELEIAFAPPAPPSLTPESVRQKLEQRKADADATLERGGEESMLESASPIVQPEPGRLLRPVHPVEMPITDHLIDVAESAVRKMLADGQSAPLSPEEADVAEAIILPGERPVLDITGGDFSTPPPGWEWLAERRQTIRALLPSIGRVGLPDMVYPSYIGTGFFVGDGVLMTNRHVAQNFVRGVGTGPRFVTFQSASKVLLDPRYEVNDPDPEPDQGAYHVKEALLVHPHWDMALLRVEPIGDKQLPPPLPLAKQPPANFDGGAAVHVIVIGYPWLDDRNNVQQQENIFRNIFGRKRLMPGYLTGYSDVTSLWGDTLHAATHDASTLGGNSGSAVLDLTTGQVLALHFGGLYLKANYAVPSWELAQDSHVRDCGVLFAPQPGTANARGDGARSARPIWLSSWDTIRPLQPDNVAAAAGTGETGATGEDTDLQGATTSAPHVTGKQEGSAPPPPSSPTSSAASPTPPPITAAPSAPTRVPALPASADWFERTSDAELVEAMHRDPQTTEELIRDTLSPAEADDLIRDLRLWADSTQGATSEEAIFDFLVNPNNVDPTLPEIIYLHGILGGHLATHGGLGGRVWLSPLAFVAGGVAHRLMLAGDGQIDLTPNQIVYPDGHIRLVYEKSARKWRMHGFVVHEFAYDWRKSTANSADQLHFFIESLHVQRPTKKFALVAHSQGSLVAALYSVRHPEWSSRVSQSIFMGAPLRGSFAPIEALLGDYPALSQAAFVDTKDEVGDYVALARTLPGLLDMLPDPDIFPGAALLYQRASWPADRAPAQLWLDQSRGLKRLLSSSPLLPTSHLIVSPGHGTVGDVQIAAGKLQPGPRNIPGDGTVPTRSAAGSLPGLQVYQAQFPHAQLPREDGVIQAIEDLLKTGKCRLPTLSPQAIADVSPIAEESIAPQAAGPEESIGQEAVILREQLRAGLLTQQDADYLLSAGGVRSS